MKKSLFSEICITELKNRINSLDDQTRAEWGSMNVSQMLAHCTEVLRNALGETQQRRKLIGYIIAPFVRYRFYDDIPYKNKGNASTFIVADKKDFKYEKENLVKQLDRFYNIEREHLNESTHPILGKFTPEQWAIGQYKHLDHHLRQFGV